MEEIFSQQRFLALWNVVRDWVSTNILGFDNAAQLVLLALAFGFAAISVRRLQSPLDKLRARPNLGRAVQVTAPLMLWIILLGVLWLAISAAIAMERPYALVSTAATLVAAWIAISLASQLVKNPIWSKLFAWVAWSIAALSILGVLGPAIELLDSVAIDIGQVSISVYDVVRSTLAIAVLLSIALYVAGLLEARIRTSTNLSPTVQVLLTKSLKIVLGTVAVLIAVRAVGIDLTALAVIGGAIGLGIGFGFQRPVSNLICGVILLIDKSIKPGDIIAVSGTYGWVTTLGGRYVSVRTRDGIEHLIPNETLISERVENWTHTGSRTRLKVDVGVHHESDLPKVIALCEAAARETERVLADPEPKCLFLEFGESALKLQLRFWIADAQNGVHNVKSAVLLKIWERFKAEQISIPYPQRDVHVRSTDAAPRPHREQAPRLA